MHRYRGQWLVWATVGVWALCVGYVTLLWAAFKVAGDTACELAPGSSVYGEVTWGWLPPGSTCSFYLPDYDATIVDGPSPVRLLVVLFIVIGLPLALYLRHLLRIRGNHEDEAGPDKLLTGLGAREPD